jgi:hypothetical protein
MRNPFLPPMARATPATTRGHANASAPGRGRDDRNDLAGDGARDRMTAQNVPGGGVQSPRPSALAAGQRATLRDGKRQELTRDD